MPFALLPPDNSTGNFIHIVERVPVRIALPADELREHPIRPGLSTVTSINITESGQSVWTSLATPSTAEYETDVYADELPTAESMAKEVMATNLVVSDRGEPVDSLLEEEEELERLAPREGGAKMLPKVECRRTSTACETVVTECPAHLFREEVLIWDPPPFLSVLQSVPTQDRWVLKRDVVLRG